MTGGERRGVGGQWTGRRLHFVGVGGAGMSAYARAAHALGASVTGSDRAESPYLARLREEGVLDARIGHSASNLPEGEAVELVYSSAVGVDNPERAAARERGIPEWPRADLLRELTALRRTIAVAGAHGKTTTSAMVVHALRRCGADPGWLIGGTPEEGLSNSHWSEGEWLVVEADESDRSMLSLHVEIGVLTNVEMDHHSQFGSLAELRDAYRDFLRLAERAIVVWGRPEMVELADRGPGPSGVGGPSGSSGVGGGSVEVVPYDLEKLSLRQGGSAFRWREQEVRLAVPGAHNALNAVAALEAARLAGAEEAAAAAALGDFHGAGRRFQSLGRTPTGAEVVEDYAHHPTEVRATLRAARGELAGGRLIAVFQPHLYSRTKRLATEFGEALAEANVVAVLEIYPARERAEDHPGVSGLTVARAAADAAAGREVMWVPGFEEAEGALRATLGEGDLCVVMGAGDVDALARRLVAPSLRAAEAMPWP